MCLYIKVLTSLTSESGISFFGVGGGAGWSDGGKQTDFIGMALPFLLL